MESMIKRLGTNIQQALEEMQEQSNQEIQKVKQ